MFGGRKSELSLYLDKLRCQNQRTDNHSLTKESSKDGSFSNRKHDLEHCTNKQTSKQTDAHEDMNDPSRVSFGRFENYVLNIKIGVFAAKSVV